MVDPIGTCQALDLLTTDQLGQLFDDQNGYLAKVNEVFDTVQILDMQQDDDNLSDVEPTGFITTEDDGGGGGTKSHRKSRSKHKRQKSTVITDKKCLILDVDNTLIYVRHFMDEMCVGDVVKLGENNAIVTKLTYKLDLEFSETPGEMTQYDHVMESKDDRLPQRGEWFPDDKNKVAMIHQADPTGCEVEIVSMDTPDPDGHDDYTLNTTSNTSSNGNHNNNNNLSAPSNEKGGISISFLQNSDELSQLEPMMHRENFLPVTFMYGGYLVRIRPGLGQFLSRCNAHYDVILFTAADGTVYSGLLKQVHNILKAELNEQRKRQEIDFNVPKKLWQQIYFRDDCDEKYDEYGLPYRHKNLAKLGRELSTIVMVDDNPLSYRGFEPNSVRVAGFWGVAEPPDDELMKTLFPILEKVHDHKDVRYYLSGLGEPPKDNIVSSNNGSDIPKDPLEDDDEQSDELDRQRQHSRKASLKFLQHLKEAIAAEEQASDGSEDDDAKSPLSGDVHSDTKPKMGGGGHLGINGHEVQPSGHTHVASTLSNRPLSDVEEQSMTPAETPMSRSVNDSEDNPSVDSISTEKMKEMEKRGSTIIHSPLTDDDNLQPSASPNPFADNFDDVADQIVNKYNSMDPTQLSCERRSTSPRPDVTDKFDGNDNVSYMTHTRNMSQASDSGIGNAGTLIYNTYDDEELMREAMESPMQEAVDHDSMHQKRPSMELDLDAKDARRTLPNTPEPEKEEDEAEENGGDYVMANGQGGGSHSATTPNGVDGTKRGVDMSPINTEFTGTNARPSRTPTPVRDEDAEILVEETSGCSCFGWFGRKKKTVGLAQQELR